ncbi:MAG TPA: DUF922 domain-containing protein [Longimicrobium sp.]|nr:DUF922 domain-containing protein [Longimicrobium sp.]
MRTSTSHRSPRHRPARSALVAACMLLAGCSPQGGTGSAPGPVYLPEARYEFYEVEGATARTLAASIRRARPPSQPGIGYTTWNVTWRAEWDGNPCRVRSAAVRATIVVSMPRWNAPPNAPRRVVEAWNRMMHALSVHEAGHVEYALAAERALHGALMRVTAPSCSEMTLRTSQVAQSVLDEARMNNERYDERTRGGWTQGVVWPPGAPADSAPADEEEPPQP